MPDFIFKQYRINGGSQGKIIPVVKAAGKGVDGSRIVQVGAEGERVAARSISEVFRRKKSGVLNPCRPLRTADGYFIAQLRRIRQQRDTVQAYPPGVGDFPEQGIQLYPGRKATITKAISPLEAVGAPTAFE